MGLLLLLSLACTLIATFIFEPALLYAVPPPSAATPAAGSFEERAPVG
jgi:hypothetical protein